MFEALNNWLISIIDLVLSAWPSTPNGMKLSTMLAGPVAAFPAAPWYLIGQALTWALFVFGGIAAIKAFKIVWP